ncbi:putative ICC-like phosphoesterase [Methanocella conradii HZ254]|uniref:ICC-like phosphoesterase n=1 Tax=Methanocella conradii (strain DSM 24694 / JCM 17849 / CGMCC 1.5162 / HZ254) TaxID=1041930 RepID=H8I4Y7_METCZ|nr:metallophosphoesterase [Methanocella conradii]AFD01081.1 putative ICC-like phosphoesterase [Methanocella conradii HZ254]
MKVEYYENAAYFNEIGVCACADVHIGIEDSLVAEGFSMPLDEEGELLSRFRAVIKRFEPKIMILNGDVLHEFGRLRRNAKKALGRIMMELHASVDEVILIEGSHDRMMGVALEGEGVRADSFYFKDGALFTHGDTIPGRAKDDDVRLIVIGHDHPMLDVEMKKEPCFLYGEKAWRGKDVLVLPAFNPLCAGTSINRLDSHDFLSPFIREGDIGAYRPIIVVEGEALEFPPLKDFRDALDVL